MMDIGPFVARGMCTNLQDIVDRGYAILGQVEELPASDLQTNISMDLSNLLDDIAATIHDRDGG